MKKALPINVRSASDLLVSTDENYFVSKIYSRYANIAKSVQFSWMHTHVLTYVHCTYICKYKFTTACLTTEHSIMGQTMTAYT